jgi:hypothetical protein
MKSNASKLQQWVDEVVTLGFDRFSDSDSVAIVLVEVAGQQHAFDLNAIGFTRNELLLTHGRNIIRELSNDGKYYALVWDGYITTDGVRSDAVLAEIGAAEAPSGLLLAQRYRRNRAARPSKVGRLDLVAAPDSLWAMKETKGRGRTRRQSKKGG